MRQETSELQPPRGQLSSQGQQPGANAGAASPQIKRVNNEQLHSILKCPITQASILAVLSEVDVFYLNSAAMVCRLLSINLQLRKL